ncbi:MAG: hypothetical protein ACRC67_12040 [Inquilinus sp.]|uniref:hypothetical protein n=1 Tax=Inquilinus sp. TaxID=1932117 RepID=UPI003F4095BD
MSAISPRKERIEVAPAKRISFLVGAVGTPGLAISVIAGVHGISMPAAWSILDGLPRVGLNASIPALRDVYFAKASGAQATNAMFLRALFDGVNATISGLARIVGQPEKGLEFADVKLIRALAATTGRADSEGLYLREALIGPQLQLDSLVRQVHAVRKQGAAA